MFGKYRAVIIAFLSLVSGSGLFAADDLAKWDPRMAVNNAVTDTNGVKWIDGKYLPIEGRAFNDTEHFYDRLPANVTTNVNEGVRLMKHHTAGMQFRFVTDSKKLRFRWVPYNVNSYMDHMPSTGHSGIDVYCYDAKSEKWLYVRTGRLGRDLSKGGTLELPWTPGSPCLVNLPLYNGVREFSLGVDGSAEVKALSPRKSGVTKPVVFYGTSITHGGCCSRPGLAFSSIVGRDLDVPIVNLGFSGSGVMEFEMSEHLARIDASCYVLDCLWNMALNEHQRPGRSVRGNYEKFIRNLRAKRPGVPIVMAEHCNVYGNAKDAKDVFIRDLYGKLIAEGWKDLVYLPNDDMFTGDYEGTVDGVHPNDRGMESMAKAFGRSVREALKLGDAENAAEAAGTRISVFAAQIVEHANRVGLSVKDAAEAFRSVGIEGFDCHYGDTNVAELVKGGLEPVNFYGDVKFLVSDGGVAQSEKFIAAALKHKVKRVMVLPDEFTGNDDKADFAKIVGGMKMFVRRAREKGLVVTTEDYGYHRKHQNPCGHVAYISQLLDAVPELMFTVDSGNLHVLEGRDAILEITREAADRICHVHLKDCAASTVPGKRGPYVTLGTGEVPNREIVRFVRNLGYTGWYTLENLTGDDLVEDAVRQIATVRRWTTTPAEPKWTRVIKFDQPDKTPLVYGGWSRSVDAMADEYCIYLDIYYDNGSLVYGPRVSWGFGTHGWEEAKGIFLPLRPVKEVHAHAFLRKGTGSAEFRDVYVERRQPRKGEAFHPACQSDLPRSNTEERLWDSVEEGKRLVSHVVRKPNAKPPKSPIENGKSVIWTADSRRTVTPLTFPGATDGSEALIELAGRERESFQICVSTAADVEWKNGSLNIPVLKTADGRPLKGTVDWQRIGYVPRRPGYYSHWSPHGPSVFEKWMPDPLLPAAPYRVRPASTQGLWVTVAAAPDAEPGEYSGTLAVTEGGKTRGTVNLKVKVRGFALPKRFGLKTAFALMDGFLRQQYGAERLRQKKTEAIDILLDHRLNPDDISRFRLPEMSDLLHAHERGMNSFNLLNVVPEAKNPNATWVMVSTPEVTGSDAFYSDFKRRLDPFVAELRKNGLIKDAYVYGFDEREQNYFAGIDSFWQKFRKDFPDIPLMTTAKMYQYLAEGKTNTSHLVTTDWYCPVTHRYKMETSDFLRSQGKKVWWYTCCGPTPPYANMAAVNWPAADGRILLGNMTWLYRADGFLFWHVNNWKPDVPLMDDADTYFPEWRVLAVPVSWPVAGCAGDGVFLYPGKDRIFPSIRLALVRDGVEDYEWLQAAAAKHGCEAADAAVKSTVTSLTEFERDVDKLRAARSRVGDLVEN